MRAIHVKQNNLWRCIGCVVVVAGKRRICRASSVGSQRTMPIRNGRNYQPTENELRSSHLQDVTPDQAREIDRLYSELLAAHPATKKVDRAAEKEISQ